MSQIGELPSHLLLVDRDTNGKDVVAQVAPFQHITYLVRLGLNYAARWSPSSPRT